MPIRVCGIQAMYELGEIGQRRFQKEVEMAPHQAICEANDGIFLGDLIRLFEKNTSVALAGKHVFLMIPPRNDMVNGIFKLESQWSRHEQYLI
jgi:hypothetical protein